MSDVFVGGRPRPLAVSVVRQIVDTVLAGEGRDAVMSVTFVGRDAMRRLNAEYRDRARPTDVLAFRLPDPKGQLVGDVYVCPWVARREAERRSIPFTEEMTRVIVHGTLHVLGYDHPEDGDRTHSPMWRRQEQYVRTLA